MAGPDATGHSAALAPNEERYLLDSLAPEVHGNPWVTRIRGKLDVARLKEAIRATCQRHEIRRARYELAESESADQLFRRIIEPQASFGFLEVSMPGATDEQVRRAVRDWRYQRNDRTPRTMTRFLLIHLGPHEMAFSYTFYHATSDGFSQLSFLAEMWERYSGRTEFPPAGLYTEAWDWDWRNSDRYQAAEAYWTEKLSGLGPLGAMPPDLVGQQTPGDVRPVSRPLSPDLVARASEAAKRLGVTEFTFYYAVSLVLLTRLTGAPRVVVEFQSAGRRSVPGSEGVQGCFSNALPLAPEVDEAETVGVLAEKIRGDIREAIAHELMPYHHIVRRTGVSARFGINWFPQHETPRVEGLEISRPDMSIGSYAFEMSLRFVRDDAGGMRLAIFYDAQHISQPRVADAARQFEALLDAFAADVEAPIASVRSDRLAPRGVLPDPDESLPPPRSVPVFAAFLERAAATPEATALAFRDETWSYGELERRSRGLAQRLRAAGVQLGDRVAILADRRPELVCAVLAAARAGAAFAVLDVAHPEARLAELARLCAPGALIDATGPTGSPLAGTLSVAVGGLQTLSVTDPASPDSVSLVSGEELDRPVGGEAAYLLFTSGSTGRPKAVVSGHAPLVSFLAWQADTFGLSSSDRFTLLSGLGHDPMLRDVFAPLSLGAVLLIPEPGALAEPRELARWVRHSRPTVAHMTPPLGRVLLAAAEREGGAPALRRVFWGGDRLPTALVSEMARVAPAALQINFYGATETPQAAAFHVCGDNADPRGWEPLGRGAAGCQLLVLDRLGRLAGPGELGEIAVRSSRPSLGYVAAGRIKPIGEAAAGGTRLYRTGDRGFYLPDGSVQFVGRADDQVKVRGRRVELGEVNAALLACAGVRAAAVIARPQGTDLSLYAFVSPKRGVTLDGEGLRRELAQRLPAYMAPVSVRVLDALPLSPNGKVDRDALAALPPPAAPARPAGPSPATATEIALAEAWRALAPAAAVTRETTFAELGVDSLSYVQGYLATERAIGAVPTGWHLRTIAQLAAAARPRPRFWTAIDASMVVRAVSIFLIVSGHFQLLRYGGGATSGLMVVAGFLMTRFQFTEVFRLQSAQPVLRGLLRLLLPTMLFSVLLFAAKAALGRDPNLSVLLLYGNFIDYHSFEGPRWGGHERYLWYIYCFVQMYVIVYLLALLYEHNRGRLGIGVREFVASIFVLGCLLRFVAPAFFIPGFYSGEASLLVLSHMPTTHLSTLMLGGMIALAVSPRERGGVMALLVGYGVLTAQVYGLNAALMIVGGGLLMLLAPRLLAPRPLTIVLLTLSASSLFIYFTHFATRSVLRAAGAPDWPLLNVLAALAAGVLAWAVWVRLGALVARRFHSAPVEAPAI